MAEISFLIYGEPKGKARPRVTRYGTYTPESTRKYEALVRKSWQESGAEPFPDDATLYCTIHAHFAIPNSYTKKRKRELAFAPHTKKPDCDNVAKAVLDALNGLAFHDDSAIAKLVVEKTYTDANPYVGVTLSDEPPITE